MPSDIVERIRRFDRAAYEARRKPSDLYTVEQMEADRRAAAKRVAARSAKESPDD